MAQSELPTSWFCLDDTELKDLGLTCCVCYQVLCEAVDLWPCCHTLCKQCSTRCGTSCPICRTPFALADVRPNISLRHVIRRQRVYCSRRPDCDWEGTLEHKQYHENSECLQRPQACPLCEDTVNVHHLEDHVLFVCPRRACVCVTCDTSVPYEEWYVHHRGRRCLDPTPPDADEESDQGITCPYRPIGCTWSGTGGEEIGHLITYLIRHVQMMTQQHAEDVLPSPESVSISTPFRSNWFVVGVHDVYGTSEFPFLPRRGATYVITGADRHGTSLGVVTPQRVYDGDRIIALCTTASVHDSGDWLYIPRDEVHVWSTRYRAQKFDADVSWTLRGVYEPTVGNPYPVSTHIAPGDAWLAATAAVSDLRPMLGDIVVARCSNPENAQEWCIIHQGDMQV